MALGGITLVLPLTHNVAPGDGTYVASGAGSAVYPTTLDVLATSTDVASPPLAFVGGGATASREQLAASRSDVRSALPGCDPNIRATGANGALETAELCNLWDGQIQLRSDAAVAMAELNVAFKARFGADLCIDNGYRTLAMQKKLKAEKGGLAAVPGRSNHGWGLAVDFCAAETSGDAWAWLNENGAVYGWENPDWAKKGGSGPHEPWHWEYTRGVQENGGTLG